MNESATNFNPDANVNSNCIFKEKEETISKSEEDQKENSGVVPTLLTIASIGTCGVLIKKRH